MPKSSKHPGNTGFGELPKMGEPLVANGESVVGNRGGFRQCIQIFVVSNQSPLWRQARQDQTGMSAAPKRRVDVGLRGRIQVSRRSIRIVE